VFRRGVQSSQGSSPPSHLIKRCLPSVPQRSKPTRSIEADPAGLT
jgi:hypothetical protein